MSMIVPWNDPGGTPCCCASCSEYAGPPNALPAPPPDTTFFYSTYDDYDLGVINVNSAVYAEIYAGGTWNVTADLSWTVLPTDTTLNSTTASMTGSYAVASGCTYRIPVFGLESEAIYSGNYELGVDLQIDLWNDATSATTNKARVAPYGIVFGSPTGLPSLITPMLFWPASSMADPSAVWGSQAATMTVTVGDFTHVYSTDLFTWIIGWTFSDFSLATTATLSPSAP